MTTKTTPQSRRNDYLASAFENVSDWEALVRHELPAVAVKLGRTAAWTDACTRPARIADEMLAKGQTVGQTIYRQLAMAASVWMGEANNA